MLVPAVGMGKFSRFWLGFYLLKTGDICLGWAVTLILLARYKGILRLMIVRMCEVEDQRCAQGALEVYIVGVLSPFINTDQSCLIIVEERVGGY